MSCNAGKGLECPLTIGGDSRRMENSGFSMLTRKKGVIGRGRRSESAPRPVTPAVAGLQPAPTSSRSHWAGGKSSPTSARATAGPQKGLPAPAIVVARRPPPAAGDFLPIRAIRPDDAWCEDPPAAITTGRYGWTDHGRRRLKREDHLYDFIIEIDLNSAARIAGLGSAVFLHLARAEFLPDRGMRIDDEMGHAATLRVK